MQELDAMRAPEKPPSIRKNILNPGKLMPPVLTLKKVLLSAWISGFRLAAVST